MYQPVLHRQQATEVESAVLPDGENTERFARHFGMDLEEGATARERNAQIGGHRA